MRNKLSEGLVTVRPEVYIMLALYSLILPIRWVFAWVTAAAIHELFHYTALKACRCKITGIQIGLNGTFISTDTITYGKETVCAMAGPMAGFCLLFAARWFPEMAICAFIQTIFNLIPIFPMDGGRVLHCLLRKCLELHVADSVCRWVEYIFLSLLGVYCLHLTFSVSLGPIPVILFVALIFKNKFINSPCKDSRLRVQ